MDNENMNWNENEETGCEAKTSPYADSPYEPVQPIEQPRLKKKSGKGASKGLVAVSLILTLIAIGCSVASIGMCVNMNRQMDVFYKSIENKLNVQQGQADVLGSSDDNEEVTGDTLSPGQVYERNVRAVVAISNQALTTNLFGQVSETASSGTGFLISEDGYIVTNYHVVASATTLKVITWDGQEHTAKLVGGDAGNDLAVLKIDGEDYHYAKLGSSDEMFVGDRVAAIGNPLGELTSTLTVGYISATDRAVNTDGTYINMLQTDAAINSGNSGGPLFNMKGEVIGITTAKYSGTSTSGATIEGIGFAIPIDDVAGMIQDLKEHGYITGAYLGVMVQDVNAEAAEMYGFPTGAYVVEVTEGSCAQKAGVQVKDIIVNIGGYDTASMSDLTRALRKLEPGEKTTITVYRSGKQVHLEITLDEKPQSSQTQQEGTKQEATQPQQEQQSGSWSELFPFFGGFGG